MKRVAVILNENFFKLDLDTAYNLKLIKNLRYDIFIFFQDKKEIEKLIALEVDCIASLHLFDPADFCGEKDLVVADIDFSNSIKDKVSNLLVLEDNMTMWHIYDHIWNEIR